MKKDILSLVGSLVVAGLVLYITLFSSKADTCKKEVKDWNAGTITIATCQDAKLGPQKHIDKIKPNILDEMPVNTMSVVSYSK